MTIEGCSAPPPVPLAADGERAMSKSRYEELSVIISLLADRWPACFAVYEDRRKPLKIGIAEDIAGELGDAIPKADLHRALSLYVGNRAYLRASITGAARIGLDGQAAGCVTPAEATYARARLDRGKTASSLKGTPADSAGRVRPAATPGGNPARSSLADLKLAARARQAASQRESPAAVR
jgi:sRNA-binding protein